MLTVAIASENADYDGEVYRVLLEMVLGMRIERWETKIRFDGWKAVGKYASAFLRIADTEGIRHVLFAVDNDGTARRRPEHGPLCTNTTPPARQEDGCRVCWLADQIPSFWSETGHKCCIVVPVQMLETWLLLLRGDLLHPS